jgi:RNA polymerase sigma factor for flagellar operon FliA
MAAARWPLYCSERGFSPGCGQVPCADPAGCGTRFFAAYTLRRIRGAMLDAMRSADWVTRSMRSKAKAIAEADAGHGLSEAELEAATGLTRRQIRDTLAGVAGRPVSFDAGSHDVAGPGSTESQAVVSSVLDAVTAAIGALDAETRVVLALRFHQGLDFAVIAGRLGATEQHVADLHNAGVLAVHDVMLRAVT